MIRAKKKKKKLVRPKLSDVFEIGSSRSVRKPKIGDKSNVFQIVDVIAPEVVYLDESLPVRFKLKTPWSFEFVDVWIEGESLRFQSGQSVCIEPTASNAFSVSMRKSSKRVGR